MLCGAQSRALSVPDCLWGLEASSLQLACSLHDSRRWDMAMGWLGWKVGEPSPSGTGSREPPDSPEDRGPSSESAAPPAVQGGNNLAPPGVAEVGQSSWPWPCLRKGACCHDGCVQGVLCQSLRECLQKFSRDTDSPAAPGSSNSAGSAGGWSRPPHTVRAALACLQTTQQCCVTRVAGAHSLQCLPRGPRPESRKRDEGPT